MSSLYTDRMMPLWSQCDASARECYDVFIDVSVRQFVSESWNDLGSWKSDLSDDVYMTSIEVHLVTGNECDDTSIEVQMDTGNECDVSSFRFRQPETKIGINSYILWLTSDIHLLVFTCSQRLLSFAV